MRVRKRILNRIERSKTHKLGIKMIESVTCPVCGMEVSETHPAFSLNHKNRFYHFCSYVCKIAFARHPEFFEENTDYLVGIPGSEEVMNSGE